MSKNEVVNKQTGEVLSKDDFNKMQKKVILRKNNSRRVIYDFSNCVTMTEQHTGHLTDINYLIKTYKPDELSAYIAQRNQYRKEILGHDFSQEPELQGAKNVVVESRKMFESLPDELRNQFPNHLEFLKFIDIPENRMKLVKFGLATERQLKAVEIPDNPNLKTPPPEKEKT